MYFFFLKNTEVSSTIAINFPFQTLTFHIFRYFPCEIFVFSRFWRSWSIFLGFGVFWGLISFNPPYTQDIDIALSAMKMTAEREEVIDFVAPYYETTGILIGKLIDSTHFGSFYEWCLQHCSLSSTPFSDPETIAPNIIIPLYDCATCRSVAEYSRCNTNNIGNALVFGQIFTVQCKKQQRRVWRGMSVSFDLTRWLG